MSRVAPFRGLRYNIDRFGTMAPLIGPSKDHLSEEELNLYRNRHRCNFIHVLHGHDPGVDSHRIKARLLESWAEEGSLIRDEKPTYYLYEITFRLPGEDKPVVRTGFMGLVRLDDYATGQVRPHEKTFTSVKEDRLASITACQANLSQIFTLYDDPAGEIISILRRAAPEEPVAYFTDDSNITHRMWLVTDPEAHLMVGRLMESRPLYIADGHHRYETCLAHRDQVRASGDWAGERSPFNYTLVYATAMQDEGLRLLPFHRLVASGAGLIGSDFMNKAARFFEITNFSGSADDPDHGMKLRRELEIRSDRGGAIGLVRPDRSMALLTLKPGLRESLDLAPELAQLDVVVLSEFIFHRCLGLGRDQAADELIFYEADFAAAAAKVIDGRAEAAFLLNPTKVGQVRAVADAGLFMPAKSTFFYPKMAAGMTINPILTGELAPDPLAD